MPKTVQPESVGFSSSRLDRIGVVMSRYVDEKKPADVLTTVARRGQTVYLHKCGMADVASARPMEFDAIFRIMSMTKPMTSVAAMMLYEEGWFDLNTPVSEFIPAFKDTPVFVRQTPSGMETEPQKTPLTFRHLFTHTSGISYGDGADDPLAGLDQESTRKYGPLGVPPTTEALVADLAALPLGFQPGTRWRYGFSIDVIGRLVEVISGKSLDKFFQERVFEPLGMVDTGFTVPPKKLTRVASVYRMTARSGIELVEQPFPFLEKQVIFMSGGGGLASTLHDYGRFAQMLVNGGELDGVRLLSPRTVRLMEMNRAPAQVLPYGFTPGSYNHAGYGYGLGMRVLMDVSASGRYGSVGEFGWDGAYATYFWIDRTEELYGLLMVQLSGSEYALHKQFKALTYQAPVD
jgi:CubicO group peptidase (beta-lactamase class C family)